MPPPPPPNPWADRKKIPTKPLILLSFWPHRLLHVKTMTSYVKQGDNTYNGINAPSYNVLSYTWGRFMDRTSQETPLLVHGIDWPVPSIQKTHFSAAAFQHAIHCAANGYLHACEWVWVDIACIPQKHVGETQEAIRLRYQEISRQVEIFYRAQEAFAWLSSFKKLEVIQDPEKGITIDDLLLHFNEKQKGIHNGELAADFLNTMELYSHLIVKPITTMLEHSWFQSLWTLQEMVLRSDAFILFDDGLLKIGAGANDPTSDPWKINTLKFDMFALRLLLSGRDMIGILGNIESMACGVGASRSTGIVKRLEQLVDLAKLKGLEASRIEFPHTAYSLAQHRQVLEDEDRIYGIVQTYGISCGPLPREGSSISRLHTLEDEFGEKLVAKSPVLSQLFIHSGESAPRRSWLITQKCKVDDYFWAQFFSDQNQLNTLYRSLKVERPNCGQPQEIYLHFEGKAWCLDKFVESSRSATMFSPSRPATPDSYRGLMLDNHISNYILSNIVDYFPDRQSMEDSVKKLYQYYKPSGAYVRESSTRQYDTSSSIKIALLASTSFPNLPVVDYVGIVLAPSSRSLPSIFSSAKGRISTSAVDITLWKRIGLIRWTEIYHDEKPLLHAGLPLNHGFEAWIE
ncbi:hypothetical protein F4810DRAFT_407054 [Camillea tinctor]|nr:hypothetical protein F4810DRAFT_407054 [Camillea tinctor]